ncbi:VOC family protein, partial [Anoxybacillus sp. LAT_38]
MTLRLIPYLVMDGNAKEAIQFYEKALDAKILFYQTFGEMPENPEFPLPEEAKDRVSHAMVRVGESDLMFSDTFPGQPHQSGSQVTICISTNDKEKSKRIYEALKQGGQVNMPL